MRRGKASLNSIGYRMYTSSYNEVPPLYTVRYSCGCETQFGIVFDAQHHCTVFAISKELQCIEGKCEKGREIGYAKETSNAAKNKA